MADRPLLIVGMIVVGLLVPLLVSGADVAIVAGGAALVLLAESPLRMGALVNLAPLISPWASLATLLWHQRLTSLDVDISWRRCARFGRRLQATRPLCTE